MLDYPLFIVSNQKEDSINIQRVKAAITTAANNILFHPFQFSGKAKLDISYNRYGIAQFVL